MKAICRFFCRVISTRSGSSNTAGIPVRPADGGVDERAFRQHLAAGQFDVLGPPAGCRSEGGDWTRRNSSTAVLIRTVSLRNSRCWSGLSSRMPTEFPTMLVVSLVARIQQENAVLDQLFLGQGPPVMLAKDQAVQHLPLPRAIGVRPAVVDQVVEDLGKLRHRRVARRQPGLAAAPRDRARRGWRGKSPAISTGILPGCPA